MPRKEREPNVLPQELADFLKDQTYACLTQATDQGTVLVIKAPYREMQNMRRPTPIMGRHELFDYEAAPVIRMTVKIYDQPQRPLALETLSM